MIERDCHNTTLMVWWRLRNDIISAKRGKASVNKVEEYLQALVPSSDLF